MVTRMGNWYGFKEIDKLIETSNRTVAAIQYRTPDENGRLAADVFVTSAYRNDPVLPGAFRGIAQVLMQTHGNRELEPLGLPPAACVDHLDGEPEPGKYLISLNLEDQNMLVDDAVDDVACANGIARCLLDLAKAFDVSLEEV